MSTSAFKIHTTSEVQGFKDRLEDLDGESIMGNSKVGALSGDIKYEVMDRSKGTAGKSVK